MPANQLSGFFSYFSYEGDFEVKDIYAIIYIKATDFMELLCFMLGNLSAKRI